MADLLKRLGKGIKKNVILPLAVTGFGLLNLNAQTDTISPDLSVITPQHQEHYLAKPTNQFTVSDTASGIDTTNSFIKFNNDTIFNWDSLNGESLNPIEGLNEMEYYFADTSGNDTLKKINFVFDTTKPSSNVSSPIDNVIYPNKPINQFTVSDTYLDSTNSYIRLNGNPIGWENSNGDTLSPTEGNNTIEYYFTDNAGNDSSIIKNFVYDTTKPSANATSPQNGIHYPNKPINQFTASDPISGIDSTNSYIRLNGNPIGWENSNGDTLSPTEGNNTIEYYFTDNAGNDSSIIKNFVYDTTFPVFNMSSIQNGQFYSDNPVNDFTILDTYLDSTNSFIRFNTDTLNWANSQGDTLNPIEGLNEIEYYFTDKAGNDTSATMNFVYDTIKPNLNVTSPEQGKFYLYKPVNSFTASDIYLDTINSCIRLNGNPIGWENSNGDTLENVLEGNNTIEYFFTDFAGNSSTVQRNFVFGNPNNDFDKHWLINPFKQSEAQVNSSYGNGDINNDGEVNQADVDSINNFLGQKVPNPRYEINFSGDPRLSGNVSKQYDRADVNADGVIDPVDKAMIVKYLNEGDKSYLPGRFYTSLTDNEKQSWFQNILSLDKTDSIPENSTPGEVWNDRNYARQIEINSKGIRNLSDITQEEYSSTISQNSESLETLRRFNLPVYSVHNTTSDKWYGGILTGDDPLSIDNWFIFNPKNDNEVNVSSLTNSDIEIKYVYGYNKGTGNFEDKTFLEWSKDSLGNDNLSYSASFDRFVTGNPKYDNENPSIDFNLKNNSHYNSNTIEDFVFSVSDGSSNNSNFLDTLWYQVDDYSKQKVNLGINEVYPPKKTYSDTLNIPQTEGEHQVKIYAKDIAGNLTNRTINLIFDDTAPNLKVNHPDRDGVYSTHPINDFNVSDPHLDSTNSYIKLNGYEIGWKQSYGDTLEGIVGDTNTAEYYFTDKAGNDTSIKRTWIYDNTFPVVSITKPLGDKVTDNELAWEIIEENLDTAWYVVNGKARGIDMSLIDSTGVLRDTAGVGFQQGDNFIELYAKDRAGNDTSIYDTVYSDSTYQGVNKPVFEDYSTKAYPNPTDGDVTIQYNFSSPQEGSINIYNLNGQSLDKELIENNAQGTKRFNITGPNGTYIYRIRTEKGYKKTGKIIKNK